MAKWTSFPYDSSPYTYAPAELKKHWKALHAGDCEPFPADAPSQEAWAHYHAGEFADAVKIGLKAGGSGRIAANKAQCIYANYLEKSEARKLELYREVADRCEAMIEEDPENFNAHYLLAYALGRYGQGISVAKALAQGLGGQVKGALETAIELMPKHADAHIALGAFHAEVVDKVGGLLARTQGASKDAGLKCFRKALEINPRSAIAKVEYANGLVMLEGEKKLKDATRLYEEAAEFEPMDAMERLDQEMARAELEDE